MTSSTDSPKLKQKVFPAQVVKILSGTRIAINRGSEHKIRPNQKVLIYCLSDEEIKDPETGESLGYLEIYKGTGKIIHIQEKMSIVESDRYQKQTRRTQPSLISNLSLLSGGEELYEDMYLLDFEDPEIGDMVKPI